MSAVTVRPFRRDDRDQVTALVNAHAAAVVPGVALPVQQVLAHLEREPGEFIVDPWVVERATVVAEQRGRIAAAAHLVRYGTDDSVSAGYRGAGEIRWLLFWPGAPFWPDAEEAAQRLLQAAMSWCETCTRTYADGTLPAPGVYGVPEQWPHVRALFGGAGFAEGDVSESVYLADVPEVARLARPAGPSGLPPDLRVTRTLGVSGTRFTATAGDDVVGYVEVEVLTPRLTHTAPGGGYSDVGNLWVEPDRRRRGVGRWLLGQAADWLMLAHVDRLLDYTSDSGYTAFLSALGFTRLTTTIRGWELRR